MRIFKATLTNAISPDETTPFSQLSHLASNQHGLFPRAVHQSGDGPSLRVEILHLGPIPKVVDGNLPLGVTENKLALSVSTKTGIWPRVSLGFGDIRL